MSKSGFSTLNRWLGRKNKDKSVPNGKLSKSSTNLSISSTNINETSQLEYNRITPLPAATTNAPFEQTFRITVLLPKDQLYVTRLGARVPLSKLLELVCDNKLLDAEKYEFRNPVDSSQVYSCDLTIGAVGLSEIRFCHKSESYDNFNADEIMKLHRTSIIRESLTSSEFSSRNSKHTTKTTSPYSSSNSLNSMDSSGVHSATRAPKLPPSNQPKMAAPPRKKRAAPRPPSQIAIPEKSPLIIENGVATKVSPEAKPALAESPLATKDFSISTPNLASSTLLHSDINGNDYNGHQEQLDDNSSGAKMNGYTEDTVLYAQVQKKNALNLHSGSVQDLAASPTPSSLDAADNNKLPEPSPRKKIVVVKKKTVAPPAPQPRGSMYSEDNISIASTNLSSAPSTPVALTTPLQDFIEPTPKAEHREEVTPPKELPTPQPRITTTTTTLLNATDLVNDLKQLETESTKSKAGQNVSKVILNRTPTPEPRSLSCEPPEELDGCYETQIENMKQNMDDDNISKQADSGIGEPVPSPIPDSLPSEVSRLDVKSNFESSSDDDDMVKVYNFKLGKTLVKPLNETQTLEELTLMNAGPEEADSELNTPLTLPAGTSSATGSETASWNFAIPISPPPNFADNKFGQTFAEEKTEQENPITPKIMERPILNFEQLKQEDHTKLKASSTPANTPVTPLDDIVGELSTIIQEKGLDTLIKKNEENRKIESAKPNTLSNFTISSGTQSTLTKPKEVLSENSKNEVEAVVTEVPRMKTELEVTKAPTVLESPISSPDEEKLYRKRSSITSLKQRRSISRSDSFHTTAIASENSNLSKRTSSQQSLDQMAGNLNRRRSSSELSIGDTPSLQSLEVMKSILNSRKNSLANSGGEDEVTAIEVNTRRPSDDIKFASLELKTMLPAKVQPEEQIQEPQQTKEHSKMLWESNNSKREQDVVDKSESEQQKHSESSTFRMATEEKSEVKSKEVPKVYRYSGPPSINFSTWNERPKVQVAIKNEGDYIFGGGAKTNDAKTVPRSFRMSTPALLHEEKAVEQQYSPPTPPAVAPKPATIQRMGIPEKDFKVPLLVKPIQDVIVESTPNLTTESKINQNQDMKAANNQRPTVESVLKPQTQTIVNTHTSTLPRTHNKRFSTPFNFTPAVNPGPQLLRSTSIKQQDMILKASPIANDATVAAAPFGQNTLRRTGFKEKMLAKEEEQQQKAINTQPAKAPSTPAKALTNGELKFTTARLEPAKAPSTPAKALTNGELKFTTSKFEAKPVTSAKLHLTLQKSTSVSISTTESSSPSTPTLKPKPPQTPKTAPVITSPPKPPAPPMMVINLKPVNAVRTPTLSEDPRDTLLAAIRNFKKDELKRS